MSATMCDADRTTQLQAELAAQRELLTRALADVEKVSRDLDDVRAELRRRDNALKRGLGQVLAGCDNKP